MNRLFLLALLVAGCQVETDASSDVSADTTVTRVVTPPQRDFVDTSAVAVPPDSAALPGTPTAAMQQAAAADALLELVRRAPGADAQTLARVTGVAEAQLGALRSRPPALDSLRRAVRSAAQRGDRSGTAIAAARAYRALAAARPEGDASRLRAEALVISALAAAPLPDWRALQATASGLSEQWERRRDQTQDAGVQEAMTQAVTGIASGAEGQNVAAVRLGANVVSGLAGSLR